MDLTGYPEDVVERIGRLGDILASTSEEALLSRTLSLGGGTALNMLHLQPPPRLSEDLDFNYRHMGQRDWGDVRKDVDESVKRCLAQLGYTRDDVRIQAYWSLGRFHVHYISRAGPRGSLKIEIGYMRRMPVMRDDARLPFEHPITGKTVNVLTPHREEQFADKLCTLLSRKGLHSYPRDYFDVAMISRQEIDLDLFTDLVMVESLIDGIDLETDRPGPLDLKQVDRLNRMLRERPDLDSVVREADAFLERVKEATVARGWRDFQATFAETGQIDRRMLLRPEMVNPRIERHPQLLWVRRPREGGRSGEGQE